MKDRIRKVVVVGGGTAGWLSAALLRRVLGEPIDIELVESEEIGASGCTDASKSAHRPPHPVSGA
jgi:tryptophan halogenase